jgi:hypothetical protein
MAKAQKSGKKANQPTTGKWMGSWKNFFIALSVVVNIGFVVIVITMMSTHALDGMFMNEGLKRYCASQNNDKFRNASDEVKALRVYTCADGDAALYFEDGFKKYLDAKGISS